MRGAAFDRFELWKEYEGIAMHFNDLIIRLRGQSLGAVAAFATLGAVVARNYTAPDLRWGLLMGVFFFLSVFWVAIWILDLGYYNRLLEGAVDALLALEADSKGSKSVDRIELSTKVEERVKSGGGRNKANRWLFYTLVIAALLVGLSVSAWRFRSSETAKKAGAADARQAPSLKWAGLDPGDSRVLLPARTGQCGLN
jgi:hypothetical protein